MCVLPVGTSESECSKVRLSGREQTVVGWRMVGSCGGGGVAADTLFSHWTLIWTTAGSRQ